MDVSNCAADNGDRTFNSASQSFHHKSSHHDDQHRLFSGMEPDPSDPRRGHRRL
jgi:hypothetical protein